MRSYASRDVTYCQNDKCKKRCWRYVGHYRFADDNYWFMEKCDRVDLQNGEEG